MKNIIVSAAILGVVAHGLMGSYALAEDTTLAEKANQAAEKAGQAIQEVGDAVQEVLEPKVDAAARKAEALAQKVSGGLSHVSEIVEKNTGIQGAPEPTEEPANP